MLRQIEVSLPPHIARQRLDLPGVLTLILEDATREIVALDAAHADELGALGAILLRTESVASSKIERIEASMEDFARALGGSKENAAAVSMVAATDALDALLRSVDRSGRIEFTDLAAAHAVLMRDEPGERRQAGKVRTVQNWIGGSDHSPRGADYIPPPPEQVEDLMRDLIEFANRDDLPALVQAALAHAQFECIHPFTDGNGRIGRGLVNAVLRRRGITTQVVIPLASALVARRDAYFAMLDTYRMGNVLPIIQGFAQAALIAARESRETARRLKQIPEDWRERLGPVRRGSSADRLLAVLAETPVLSAEDAVELVGGSKSSVYEALARLSAAGVLENLTDRRRNQLFGAPDILAELADLDVRIGAAARA